ASLVASTEEASTEAANDVTEHAKTMRELVEANAGLELGENAGRAIDGVRGALDDYITAAQKHVALAKTDRAAATTSLPEFLAAFKKLEGNMEQVSDVIQAGVEEARAD